MPTKEKISPQEVIVKPKAAGWLIAYIVLSLPSFISGLVWFIISILLLIGVIGAVSAAGEINESTQDTFSYSLIEDSGTAEGILVYRLNGAIDSESGEAGGSPNTNIYTDVVADDFEKIKNDNNIKNIVFHLDTPGGTVFASEVLGDLIGDLMQDKGLEQAVFYYNQVVASGGLYASNKVNNYIYGSPYGSTGSIGVVLYLPNVEELANNIGYKQVVIKSGESKDFGNPFRDLTDSERDFLQSEADRSYGDFIDIVATGRNLEKEQVEEAANGFVYNNEQAKSLGLIDEVGALSQAVEKAASNIQLDTYQVWESEPKTEFLDIFGEGLVKTIIPNIVTKEDLLPKSGVIKPGKQYYLDPLHLHE